MTGSVAIVAIVAMLLAFLYQVIPAERSPRPAPETTVAVQFPPKDRSRLQMGDSGEVIRKVIIDPNMPLPDRKPSNGD